MEKSKKKSNKLIANGYTLYVHIRRLIIFLIGLSVLLLGALMIILPGPGLVLMLIGLIVLATEFIWAKKLLKEVREYYNLKIKKRLFK